MRQNQCVSCTECVNIPEFRLKKSNIRFIEKTLEENPVHGQRMDLPEIEAQPALQTIRNNQRRDIPIDQLQRRAINKVYKTIPKKVPKKTVQEVLKEHLIVERTPKKLKQEIINQAVKEQTLKPPEKNLLSVYMTNNSFKRHDKQRAL